MKDLHLGTADISLAFHKAIAEVCVRIAIKLKKKYKINKVALSGGVFQNRLLLGLMIKQLSGNGFEVLTPIELPFNDGCIAHGQIAVVKALLDQKNSV